MRLEQMLPWSEIGAIQIPKQVPELYWPCTQEKGKNQTRTGRFEALPNAI